LKRIPVKCQSQLGPIESQPKDMPRALKLKQPKDAVLPAPMDPVLPSADAGLGRNSVSKRPDDGKYGSVGGGTTVKPSEKKNLW
jgi:hypothetical protein